MEHHNILSILAYATFYKSVLKIKCLKQHGRFKRKSVCSGIRNKIFGCVIYKITLITLLTLHDGFPAMGQDFPKSYKMLNRQ